MKKQLVYLNDKRAQTTVTDLFVADVWDGWCNLKIKLEDGSVPNWRIHSMCLVDMNTSTSSTEARHQNFASIADDPESFSRKQNRKCEHRAPEKVELSRNMPSDFVVFDIEATGTQYQKDEICEIAALKVVDGKVIDEYSTLVYIDGSMPKAAEDVHHISKTMLENAPHMRAALSDFLGFLGDDQILVGHNIQTFDIPFIKRVSELCGQDFSFRGYADTLALAREAWPEMDHHRMDDCRSKIGLADDGAHRALKDCMDELAVYRAIKAEAAIGLPKPVRPPKQKKRSTAPRKSSYSSKWSRKKARDFRPNVDSFDEQNPLYGKSVVISGDVEGFDYDFCMQKVCDLGGTPQDNVTRKTDYLVLGPGAGAGKLRKAQELQAKGIDVKVIDPQQFKTFAGLEL